MPVNISPKDEPIWKYLLERKNPVTRAQIEKYFLISKSNALRTLSFLEKSGLIDVIKVGNQRFYKIKD